MKSIITKAASAMLLLALLASYSCKKDYDLNNPFDKNNTLKPEDWSAKDLQIENLSVIKKKPTWGVKNEKIAGYIIDRRNNNNGFQLALAPELKRYGRIATNEPAGFPRLQIPNIFITPKGW